MLGKAFIFRGNFGVDIFFVLSGFIMYMTAERRSVDGWSFFLKRLFRVFPTYWFFTLLLVCLCSLMPHIYSFTDYTLDTLVGSLLFIPNKNPSGIGIFPFLTVGWTLNFEIVFYTTLAICLLISTRWAVYLCAILLIIFPLLFAGNNSAIYSVLQNPLLLQFVSGMSVGWIYTKMNPAGTKYYLLGGFMFIFATVLVSGILGYNLVLKSIAATMFVASFLLLNNLFDLKYRLVNFAVKLGDYSYSTYLSHVLIIGIYLSLFGNELSYWTEVAVLCAITFTTYFVSSYSYRYVENSKIIFNVRNSLINLKNLSARHKPRA